MSFAAGLRQALDLRQRDVDAELRQGDTLENVLDRHLLVVEKMSDREILTSVLLLSSDGKHLTHGAAPSLPKEYRDAINGSEIGPEAGSCGTAAYFGKPVYVTDSATDPLSAAYRDYALPHGLRSCWSTPIRNADGEVMGTFAVYNRSLSGPTRDELNAIAMITDNVAQAITWARNSNVGMRDFDILPQQVAALGAIATAIANQSDSLDSEGRAAVDDVVNGVRRLSEVIQRQMAGADPV